MRIDSTTTISATVPFGNTRALTIREISEFLKHCESFNLPSDQWIYGQVTETGKLCEIHASFPARKYDVSHGK